MKKNYFLTAFLFVIAYTAFSQNCDATFYRYNNSVTNAIEQIALTSSPGFWLSSVSPEPASSYTDMTLIRVDALGNEIWRKEFGTPNKSDISKDLLATQDGNMVLAGQGNDKIRLVKVDENGTVLWEKEFGEAGKQYEVNHLYEDPAGNILLAGRVAQGSVKNILVLKLDAQGVQLKKLVTNPFILQWEDSGFQPGFGASKGNAITSAENGTYLLTGSSVASEQFFPSPGNVVVYRLDADLNIVWTKDFFGADGCYNTFSGQAIVHNADNSITVGVGVGGYCLDGGSPHHLLYKLDQDGNKLWEKYYSSGTLVDLFPTADGNFISYSSFSTISKVDPDGNLIWKSWFKYEISLYGKNAVVEFPDGHLGFSGYSYSNGPKAAVAISDALGNNCRNRLSGTVYFDQNGNCKQDPGEPGLANKLLELTTGPEYTLTDQDGQYLFITDTLLQNIKAYPTAFPNQPNDFWQVNCPPTGIQTFGPTAPYQHPDSLDFGLSPADICPVFHIKTSLSSGRICTEGLYRVEVCNDGSQDAGDAVVKLTFPPEIQFLAANYPFTYDGVVYSFDLGALPAGECTALLVSDSIHCNATLGATVCIEASVEGTPSCATYQYAQTDQLCRVLVNSYDPNDITGWVDNQSPCFGADHLGEKTALEYMIRFQNTGNDTAYRVMVIDTLPVGKFDMTTFRPGTSSHPYHLDFRSDNILVWVFEHINLTDTVTNVLQSEGFVTYRVATALPVMASDVFKNRAAIYFDANPPVFTNENSVALCLVSSQFESPGALPDGVLMMPNPARDYVEMQFERPLTRPVSVELFDVSGVLVDQLTLEEGAKTGRLDTRLLPNGMYYFRLETGGLKRVQGKLVVMH